MARQESMEPFDTRYHTSPVSHLRKIVYLNCALLLCTLASAQMKLAPVYNAPIELSDDLSKLDVHQLSTDWTAWLEQMKAVNRVMAPFSEERTFAFRKKAKRYEGVFRKSIDGSVSLVYSQPQAMALHVGEDFAFYRKGEGGAVRSIPQSSSQSDALAVFPQLMAMDLAAMSAYYEIFGALAGESWRLVLIAKVDASIEMPYERVALRGIGTDVASIELVKSEKQGIVITLEEAVYPETFSEEEQARYFFTAE